MIVTMLTFVGAWAQEIVFFPATDPVSVAVGDTYNFTIKQLQDWDGSNVTGSSLTVVEGTPENCSVSVQVGQALTNALYGDVNINVTPSQAGTYKIRVYLSTKYNYGVEGGNEATKDITIIAYDPTLATSLSTTPASTELNPIKVDKGATTSIDVNISPASAATYLTLSNGVELAGVTAVLTNDNKSISIDASAAEETGTATFILTPKEGSDAAPVTIYVEVVAPRVPVTASCPSVVRMGESLNATAVLGGGLDPNDYTISYSSDAAGILAVDEHTGALTPVALGSANITVTATGGTYAQFSQTFPVSVAKGEYTLVLTPDPAAVGIGIGGKSTIRPTVTLNGVPVETGYNINYTLKSIPVGSGVTISENVVDIPNTVSATGSVVVGATLSASVNAGNYNTPEAEATILIDKVPTIELNTQVPENKIETYLETNNWEYKYINPAATIKDKEGTQVYPTPAYTYEIIAGADKIHMHETNKIVPDAEGNAQIKVTATATYDGITISDSKIVDVEVKTPTGLVTATENSATIEKNESQKITLTQDWTGLDKSQSTLSYEISSDDPSIAIGTINKGGNEENVVTIDAIGVGTTTIHIKGIAKKGSHTFETTVKDIEVTVPTVTPTVEVASLSVNHDQKLSLAAIESAVTVTSDGNTLVNGDDYDIVAKYASNDAVITSEGINGADYEDAEHTQTSVAITISVVSKKPELYNSPAVQNVDVAITHLRTFTLSLSADKTKIKTGETATITPSSTENSTDVTVTYNCTSSNELAATAEVIDGKVVVTGVNDGTTTITVTANPESASYVVMQETIDITVSNTTDGTVEKQISEDGKTITFVCSGDVCNPAHAGGGNYWDNVADEINAANYETVVFATKEGDAEKALICKHVTHAMMTTTTVKALDFMDVQIDEIVAPDHAYTTDPQGTFTYPSDAYKQNETITILLLPEIKNEYKAGHKHVPSYCAENITNLQLVVMPNNATCIEHHAFTNMSSINTVILNDGLKMIGHDAFDAARLNSLSVPASMEYIGKNAFGAGYLHDVYFLGEKAPIVEMDAFGSKAYMNNNSVTQASFATEYKATRDNYVNGDYMAAMMHLRTDLEPVERAAYTDITRDYHVFAHELTKNGVTVTVPSSDPSIEFKRNLEGVEGDAIACNGIQSDNSVIESKSFGVEGANIIWAGQPSDENTYCWQSGYYDKYVGTNYRWPSQADACRAYSVATNNLLWNGTTSIAAAANATATSYDSNCDGTADRTFVAGEQYIGLHQFILVTGDVSPSTSTQEWDFNTIGGANWYTICVPVSMTVEEVRTAFGPQTQVCKFNKVVRDTNDHIKFYFTDEQCLGETNLAKIAVAENEAYMIRPSHAKDADYKFTLPQYTLSPTQIPIPTVLTAKASTAENAGDVDYTYTFIGQYNTNSNGTYLYMPQYSYYLGADKNNTAIHRLFMQSGTTGKWKPFTCVIIPSDPQSDYDTFFDPNRTKQSAKGMSIVFGLDEPFEDFTTGINYEIICGSENAPEAIYNLNGQSVGNDESKLTKGIYIKNGKKFIVK